MSKMRMSRRLPFAASAAAVALVAGASVAQAATGSWSVTSGMNTTPIYIYNWWNDGAKVSAPATVPASSTVTSIKYEWDYRLPQTSNPGSMLVSLCANTTSNCTPINAPRIGTTNIFNGYPPTTKFFYRMAWTNPDKGNSAIVGGMPIYNTAAKITVNYQY